MTIQIEEIKAAVDAARERQARNSEWYAGSQWQKADAALIALWEQTQEQESTDE